jgi:acyl-CoA dehydrogenase
LEDADRLRGLDAFDRAFWDHVGHSIANTFRAFGRAWTGGLFAPTADAGVAAPFYRQLSRHAAAFALAVDLSLLTLGGRLKREEMLSARFGDILSELYLSSAALKRWNDEGRQKDDFPLLEWCMETSFATIETRFDEIIANFPVRPVAWLLRLLIQPFGPRRRGPSDRVTNQCAAIITNPCPSRDRLTVDLFTPTETDHPHAKGIALLERAFAMTVAVQPIRDRMHTAHVRDVDQAVKQRTITADEAAQLKAAAGAVAAAIAVDDFAPEELTSRGASDKGDVLSQATSQPIFQEASQPRPAAAE